MNDTAPPTNDLGDDHERDVTTTSEEAQPGAEANESGSQANPDTDPTAQPDATTKEDAGADAPVTSDPTATSEDAPSSESTESETGNPSDGSGQTTEEDAICVTVFGPYVGEFGHEVRGWSPMIRAWMQEHECDNVVIVAYEGREPLYQEAIGAGAEFLPIPTDLIRAYDVNADCMGLLGPHTEGAMDKLQSYVDRSLAESFGEHVRFDHKHPRGGLGWACEVADHGIPIHFGLPDPPQVVAGEPVVVGIIARGREYCPHRNYKGWEQVVENIRKRMGDQARIVCLGATTENLFIDGADTDARVTPYRLAACLKSFEPCHVIVGESSGGMHLALAAARNCVVFGEARVHRRYINDNWHRVPLRFIDGLAPAPEIIGREVHRMVAGLGGDDRYQNWELPQETNTKTGGASTATTMQDI